MAPKGGNAKKESGRAKKAENEVRRECSHRVAVAVRDVVVEWLRTNRTVAVRLFCGKKKNRKRKRLLLKSRKRSRKLKSGSLAVRFSFLFLLLLFPKIQGHVLMWK